MIKRISLFLLTNILVMLTISMFVKLLGIQPYLTRSGLNLGALAAFSLVWGFSGAFISLAISRQMAKWMQGVSVIDPRNPGEFSWLVQMVHDLARRAKLPAMPEVGVYDSPEVNAFATGPTKSRSLVAVSRGLLQQMNRNEIEGVIGHEIAHIQNGDMVTMTLLQGVVNAFSLFVSRIIAYLVAQAMSSKDEEGEVNPAIFYIVSMIADIFLTLLGSIVVCWYSRQREYRADIGSARLSATKDKMSGALERLGRVFEVPVQTQPALASMKISSHQGGWGALFRTHPPLSDRLARLEQTPL
jgi:heat shock protein HtpX